MSYGLTGLNEHHGQVMNPYHTAHVTGGSSSGAGASVAARLVPAAMGLTINFFRPVWQAALRAEARVVNRGKNLGYIECEVLDQDDRLIAKATSTCLVLRGDQARRVEVEGSRHAL